MPAAANTQWIDKVRAHANQMFGVPVHYTGAAVYATGGDTFTAQQLGLKNIYAIEPAYSQDNSHLAIPLFTTNKGIQSLLVKWIVVATGLEVGNGVDISAEAVRFMVWGN